MELSVTSTSITEPITVAEVKSFMGYPTDDTSQDNTISGMIRAAREFVEARTGLSIVSKEYKAYFEEEDSIDGWYELPVSPVDKDEDITITMNGVDTSFQKKGQKTVSIYPDATFGTINVGTSFDSYIEVTFTAGATNDTANEILKRIVSFMFNHRDDGIGISIARLPFDTVSLLNSISSNL